VPDSGSPSDCSAEQNPQIYEPHILKVPVLDCIVPDLSTDRIKSTVQNPTERIEIHRVMVCNNNIFILLAI